MKKAIYTGLAFLLVASLSACSSYDYYTAARNKTNLSAYRTFAWAPPGVSDNKAGAVLKKEIADERVKDAAVVALENKGLRQQERNPDLLVSYSTITGRGTRTEYYPVYAGGYPGFGWGLGWGYGYRSFYGYYGGWGLPYYAGSVGQRVSYKEGTLIIDLIDARTRNIVWRGFGVGELHNPKKTVEELPKVVDGILKQLELNNVQRSTRVDKA